MTKFRSGFLTGVILTAIVFLTCSAVVVRWETKTVAYREGLRVTVDGEEVAFDVTPMIVDPGWIMCQLEPVLKKMGWAVAWDDASSTLKIGDDYDKYDDEAYVWLVERWLSDWRESASTVVAAMEKFEKSPNDKALCAALVEALGSMWINSDRLLGIKPTPKYKDTHTYLVQAMNESKSAVENCRLWAKTLDWQAGRDGSLHLERMNLYLQEFTSRLQSLTSTP